MRQFLIRFSHEHHRHTMSDSLVEEEDGKVARAVRFWTSQAIDSAAARLRARIDRSPLYFPSFSFTVSFLSFLLLRISSHRLAPLSLHSLRASIQVMSPTPAPSNGAPRRPPVVLTLFDPTTDLAARSRVRVLAFSDTEVNQRMFPPPRPPVDDRIRSFSFSARAGFRGLQRALS